MPVYRKPKSKTMSKTKTKKKSSKSPDRFKHGPAKMMKKKKPATKSTSKIAARKGSSYAKTAASVRKKNKKGKDPHA